MNNNNSERINLTGTIKYINKYLTSTSKDYLLLKLEEKDDKGDFLVIWCFNLSERWGELEEGKSYEFICRITDRGGYALTDFIKK